VNPAPKFIRKGALFSALFNKRPPLEESSIRWLFDAYGWAFRNLSSSIFHLQTTLVLADDVHFPLDAHSTQGRAELLFKKAAEHAGMGHWPWQLHDCTHYHPRSEVVVPAMARQAFRGAHRLKLDTPFPVIYDPRLAVEREVLLASFARVLAGYLVRTLGELPPGGISRWSHGIDLLAIFLGFGVIYANSLPLFLASTQEVLSGQQGKCERNHLSRWDATYALAIFCALKSLPRRQVLPCLKRPLRSFFLRAMADVENRPQELKRLGMLADPGMKERYRA
jgi:hypothetical protein